MHITVNNMTKISIPDHDQGLCIDCVSVSETLNKLQTLLSL